MTDIVKKLTGKFRFRSDTNGKLILQIEEATSSPSPYFRLYKIYRDATVCDISEFESDILLKLLK